MRKKIKYGIFFLLAILTITVVGQTHKKQNVPVTSTSVQSLYFSNTQSKRVTDMIHYLSFTQKITIDTDKSCKHKYLCQQPDRPNHHDHRITPSQIIKNQLTHFQADYPITYYIYTLKKILT